MQRVKRYFTKMHKGTTLIELILVLSVLVILMGFCITNYFKLYDNWANSTNIDFCNNYILHMLKNSAVYCENENKSGYLLFIGENKVKFYCDNKKIKEYKIPMGFRFINIESFNQRIGVNNLGEILKACTINYEDIKGKVHIITIRVGTRYAQIK
ncbi:prepilin-type N-terminal cleavage/methylation domain-containing protein [Clostridium bovifaecis]|uniref:Prepilin-type N-terminal cleavage/methylation domain-containing protein n=1 Tax=Clostridium bovifaecis TaxID=2184719 RepID=A0A6I6F8T9_9CLOT|nr:prepilin-type N-terminal cleavage/methylation domain-containing protein [Clostridium bovifaecis]